MSVDEVKELRRSLSELRIEVHALRDTIGIIHDTVVDMASKVYIPKTRVPSWFVKYFLGAPKIL